MAFELAPLPYSYNALQPYIDSKTMEIHHDKHHKSYVTNLNSAIANTELDVLSIEEILKNASTYSTAIRNNAGGHYNHMLFWNGMRPGREGRPEGAVNDAIIGAFGSFEIFKAKFDAAGTGIFGSGWVWLITDQMGRVKVTSTPNQDNPLMDVAETAGSPLLCLDVWEHAYYLKYQNRRADYISAWWNVVDWKEVNQRFEQGTSKKAGLWINVDQED